MKQTRNVTIKTLTLGTPETIQLPRNYAIRGLILRLSGTININSASVPVALPQGAANLLSNIRIRRDGKDTMYSLGGQLTYELNKVMYGKAGSTTVPANTNATNVAVSTVLQIPFENVQGVKPFDTLLATQVNGKALSSLDLLIDTAAPSAMFTGGTTVVIGTNVAFTLEVDVIEEIGVNNFVFGDIKQYLAQKVAVTGASNNFQIKPISTGNYYKGFLLFVEDAGQGSDSVLTNIKLKSGSEVFVDRPAQALKDELLQKLSMPQAMTTGVYYIDLMSDGSLNQTLDVTEASGRSTLEFEMVTAAPSGTCNIYVVALEYVPPTIVKK